MGETTTIINCAGGHAISIYRGAEYNEAIRKHQGGVKVAEIPYSGKFYSAKQEDTDAAPLIVDGVEIPTITRKYAGVERIPDDGNLYIVSAPYAVACKEAGLDTSRLLTIGNPVCDEQGRVIGCTCLIRN